MSHNGKKPDNHEGPDAANWIIILVIEASPFGSTLLLLFAIN
jgi:hypothetical protein